MMKEAELQEQRRRSKSPMRAMNNLYVCSKLVSGSVGQQDAFWLGDATYQTVHE